MFFDQAVTITQPVNLEKAGGFKAEYVHNADWVGPRLTSIDFLLSNATVASTSGKTYYVSGTGSDNNNGLTQTNSFRTLQKAADMVKTGDTVYIMNGTYTQPNSQQEIVVINKKQGTSNAPITFKAYPGHNPLIKSKNPTAIKIIGSSYIKIEGLRLEGNNDNITLDYARQQKNNLNNPLTMGNGIEAREYSHHIVIRNNKISKFGGGAIALIKTDYITVENNVVYQNCFYSPWGANTISTYQNWNYDNNSSQYKMIFQGNIVYENKSLIPWFAVNKITEGHGIMIDDSLNTQANSNNQRYKGKTLISNNIMYKNGGAGIQVFSSAYVDVVNNTSYENGQLPETANLGEIAVVNSEDVKVFNNIMQPKKDGVVNNIYNVKNTVYDYNLIYNSSKFMGSQAKNIFGKDPKFVDAAKRNFSLRFGSAAIDTGISTFNGVNAPKFDQRSLSRPQDGDKNGTALIDIGALEFPKS